MLYRLLLYCFFLSLASSAVATTDPVHSKEDYQSLELLTDVLSLVQHNYVEEVSLEQLIGGAVRGIIETLDPHSSYLSAEAYEDFLADTQGEFGGLGIELSVRNRELVVVAPIENSPASRAGILPGDQIIAINGIQARDLDMVEAVKLMRGASGEAVTLTIRRAQNLEPFEVTLVREIIRVQSVRSQLFEQQYGYLRIAQFQDHTDREMVEHLQRLQQQSSPLVGLILDLRNNPGGLLDQAVAVADVFLSSGLIVSTVGRHPDTNESLSAQQPGTEALYPLIVLINGGSASAAEIVAGALQDHKRALILGEQSFGKGSVQTIIELGDGSGLRVTTAHYYTPSGRSIQARGIIPDILVQQRSLETFTEPDFLREKDLKKHLPAQGAVVDVDLDEERILQMLQDDYQLQRALDLLKGLARFADKKWTPPSVEFAP